MDVEYLVAVVPGDLVIPDEPGQQHPVHPLFFEDFIDPGRELGAVFPVVEDLCLNPEFLSTLNPASPGVAGDGHSDLGLDRALDDVPGQVLDRFSPSRNNRATA